MQLLRIPRSSFPAYTRPSHVLFSRESKWGLSKWGLKALVNNCPRLPIVFVSVLGQKSCRTKVPRIFRIFVPNFAPNLALNFHRIFRGLFVLRFVGDGDQKRFTQNPRHFSMQNSQANTKKIFTKFVWRACRQSNIV